MQQNRTQQHFLRLHFGDDSNTRMFLKLLQVLTFVHLSDIHFSQRDDSSQRDLDQHIRRALLKDLASPPTGKHSFDAILITGDIAFSGQMEEYRKAKEWLDEVYEETGLSMATTYMVPGNHDVARSYIKPKFSLWDTHLRLRSSGDPVFWHDVLCTLIYEDPARLLLSPLTAYNSFAQGCGCESTTEQLAWQRTFEKPLEDGTRIRFHGLNSAIISDEGDEPGKLLVSDLQTSKFQETPGLVDLVLCHHPPDWLMGADKSHLRNILRKFVPIALFGHEHSFRTQADLKHLQLFAGAVQPSRRDRDWLPTYHILQIQVVQTDKGSELLVRVHTREFDSDNFIFKARRDEHENPISEHRLPHRGMPSGDLPPHVIQLAPPTVSAIKSAHMPEHGESTGPTPAETAQRELLVHFFELPTPLRYAAAFEAGLLREGDDSLHPQIMWAEVFRRANQEKKFAQFWNAVSSHSQKLRTTPNPFSTETQ
jgi:predicted MPP superfamily phosphohydrolase